jgi:hypothetical protein
MTGSSDRMSSIVSMDGFKRWLSIGPLLPSGQLVSIALRPNHDASSQGSTGFLLGNLIVRVENCQLTEDPKIASCLPSLGFSLSCLSEVGVANDYYCDFRSSFSRRHSGSSIRIRPCYRSFSDTPKSRKEFSSTGRSHCKLGSPIRLFSTCPDCDETNSDAVHWRMETVLSDVLPACPGIFYSHLVDLKYIN